MEKNEKFTEPGKFQQILAAMLVNLFSLSYGTVIGWQSPYAPQLQKQSTPVGHEPMTDEDVSWLSGTLCLGGTLMTILLTVIPDKFSRKRLGFFMALPLAISWILILFATEHIHIYIARFLAGVSGAGAFYIIPNYLSEISGDSIRGLLGSILPLLLNTGILLTYILGGMMSIKNFTIIGLVISILYMIMLFFIPESPVYLVRQNNLREAAKSLMWLKGGDSSLVERTLTHLKTEVKEASASTKSVKFSDLFRDKASVKGMIIILGVFCGQQLCGIFAMISYTETIFNLAGSSLSPNTAAIIVALIQLIGSVLSSFLLERTGRRPLFFVSCVGMCVCHWTIATFCYFQEFGYDTSSYGWVPVFALSTFMVVYSVGMGTGPIVVAAEILQRDIASLGISIGLVFLWITAFTITKVFPDLITLLNMHGCFYLLGTFCVITFLFCLVLLPETKGRTRDDIVNELNGKSDKKNIIGTCPTSAAHV